jgi:hypothetical protein
VPQLLDRLWTEVTFCRFAEDGTSNGNGFVSIPLISAEFREIPDYFIPGVSAEFRGLDTEFHTCSA